MSNSYLNFVEVFYASNNNLPPVEVAKAARAHWETLPSKEKHKYHMESNEAAENLQDDLAMECGTCGKKKKNPCAKKKKKSCPKKKRNPCAKKKKPSCKKKPNPCKKKKKRRQICC
ncbi:sexual differentiation process protein isp3-like [Teleopsis dalmanni]|uniref:sexual differentiation process protein isp3-like n=1 Tax=Teleopsis dalmanni TaxID=139649 RepID=UPI0018CDFA5F|nr:sexual differentiation process protein isp3-like [Teleopsis dalmanni]XP_037956349.1 sexual differentiation process protein isp3-like [Teleopsis dalmanni]